MELPTNEYRNVTLYEIECDKTVEITKCFINKSVLWVKYKVIEDYYPALHTPMI